MNNKIKEAKFISLLQEMESVTTDMKNIRLQSELVKRIKEFREFVLNPGVSFEPGPTPTPTPTPTPANPPVGLVGEQPFSKWFFPDPAGDDKKYAAKLATQMKDGVALSKSTPYKKMEMNFNWLMENYGCNVAYSYICNAPKPIMTISNQFRNAYDASASESAYILNYYLGSGPGMTRSGTSEDGSMFQYGGYGLPELKFYLPYPTGTVQNPTPPI
jgi:hypothetical protein